MLFNPVKIVIFILLFTRCEIIFSQQLDFISGDTVDLASRSFEFYDFDNTSVSALRISGSSFSRKYHLEKYDRNTLKLISNTRIPFSKGDSTPVEIKNLIINGDENLFFYSYFNYQMNREQLEVINFDDEGKLKSEPKVLIYTEGQKSQKALQMSVTNIKSQNRYFTTLELTQKKSFQYQS